MYCSKYIIEIPYKSIIQSNTRYHTQNLIVETPDIRSVVRNNTRHHVDFFLSKFRWTNFFTVILWEWLILNCYYKKQCNSLQVTPWITRTLKPWITIHSSSTQAKFSEKLTYLAPWYGHLRACQVVRNVSISENLA